MDSMEHIGLIGDGSEFQGYFVIFLDIVFQEQCGGDCSYNAYFAHVVNHSVGLIA